MSLVFAICFAIWTIILWNNGLLLAYFLPEIPTKQHELYSQVILIGTQTFRKIPYLLCLFGPPIVLYQYLKKRSSQAKEKSLSLLATLILLSVCGSIFVQSPGLFARLCPFFYNRNHADICLLFIVPIICLVQLYILKNKLEFLELVIFIISIMFPVIIILGSGSGLAIGHMGMWLLGGLMISIFLKTFKTPEFNSYKYQLLVINLALITTIGTLGLRHAYFYRHYDLSDRSKLTAEFRSPRLAGIYTSPERAKSLDSLLEEIAKFSKKGDLIFAYHNIPMIYFASGNLPYGNHAWLDNLTPEAIRNKIDSFPSQNPPALIIKCKTNAENSEWGIKPLPLFDECDNDQNLIKIQFMDKILLAKWDLKLLWSNADFDLYKPGVKTNLFQDLNQATQVEFNLEKTTD